MDDLSSVVVYKDTTVGMLFAASKRNYEVDIVWPYSMHQIQGEVSAKVQRIVAFEREDSNDWYTLETDTRTVSLADYDCILMRKDPPFNIEYINMTYMLSSLQDRGVLVVNSPTALRDLNEKCAISLWPDIAAPYIVSNSEEALLDFANEKAKVDKGVVLKPLDGMGGTGIFVFPNHHDNLKSAIEVVGNRGRRMLMLQEYLPQIAQGDKRILIIDGKPVSHLLARIPQEGDLRANLAVGGIGEVRELSDTEFKLAEVVGDTLRKRGVLFAGIDMIGDKLSEINITSPTGAREVSAKTGIDATDLMFDAIESKLH